MMPGISVILQGQGAWEDDIDTAMGLGQFRHLGSQQSDLQCAGVSEGPISGEPGVLIRLDLEDPLLVLAEVSLRALLDAVDALVGEYGDPRT
jgi:hypothetical protein